jgi:hypothetical protein
MTPIYQITANGADITANLKGRLLDLTITDQRGFDSDSLELTLDDTDAGIIWPRRGVELSVKIGYAEESLFDHGKYVVDETAHSGAPDKVTIRAKAPDLLAQFKGAKTRAWDKTTLGAVIQQLASDNKLTAAISPKLAAEKVDHFDQTQESDINVLTRLGERYGATGKIADGKLIFAEAGKAETVSGKPMPVVKIDRSQIDTHSYTEAGRGEYTGVEAVWHDYREAKRKKATATADPAKAKRKSTKGVKPPKMVVSNEEETAGSADNVKRLKQTFPDEATAKAAAAAEWLRLQRNKETLELDIKHGMPGLRAETRIPVTGIRPWINGDWIALEVTHSLSASSGLTTRVRLERPDDYNAEAE